MYDAFLLISFGGPEKRDDVIPFLENVLRGRNVPRERLLAVAEHYYHFDGVSPINQQNRDLVAALRPLIRLPIYWGNRNWHPMLADTIRHMRDDGVQRAVALATSAFGSYSGCRQYREDIDRARAAVASSPEIDKLPPFGDDSGFLAAVTDRVRDGLSRLPNADVVYTAHSIPMSMAQSSPYVEQLLAVCRAVNKDLGLAEPVLAFQSRSGPPGQPWLEPDILDYLRGTRAKQVIVMPVGFLSDHMEVLYDLDTEAAALAVELGIEMFRARTVGLHPAFIEGLARMIEAGPSYFCAEGCCRLPVPVSPAKTARG